MRRIILSAALVAVTAVSAKAETVYIGNAFIDFVSGPGSCTQTFVVGDFFRVAFRPGGGAFGNGASSHLAATGTRAGVVLRVEGGSFQTPQNYAGQIVSSSNTIASYSGAITVWQQTAGNELGVPTIKFKGRFSNFFKLTGCFVELRGKLLRR
jgi:hypothetical protein